MSRLWNEIGRRYEDAVAVFAAAGRLVEYDDSGALVTVNGEEMFLEPATLVTAAQMMAKNGIVGPEEDLHEANVSTARGEIGTNERRQAMTFHDCSVLNKRLFAGPDGYCRQCRSVELAAQILDREVVTFEDLLDQIGGEEAYAASVEEIRTVKQNGRPGNSVPGRKTRELLNLILTQHPMFIGELLDVYRTFAGKYGIALRHDPDGVLFHDYHVFVQPAFPEMVPSGNTLRDHRWQANVAEKRAMRNAFVEGVRVSRQIVMRWLSSDGDESGVVSLGPNTEETRRKAAEYQAAAQEKGFRTRFSLVRVG
jgi:hypothetical protein